MRFLTLLTSALLLLLLHTTADCREYHYDRPQTPFITGAVDESFAPPHPPTQPHYHSNAVPHSAVVRTQNGQSYEVSMTGSQQIYQGRVTAQQSAQSAGRAYPPPATVSYNGGGGGGAFPAQHEVQTAAYQSGQYAGQNVAQVAYPGVAPYNPQYSSNVNPLLATQHAPHAAYAAAPQQGAAYNAAAAQAAAYQSSSAQSGNYAGQTSHANQATAPTRTTYYVVSKAGSTQAGGGGYQPAAGHSGPFRTGVPNYQGSSQAGGGGIQSGRPQVGGNYAAANYYQGNPNAATNPAAAAYAAHNGGAYNAASAAGATHAGSIAAQYQPTAYNQGQTQSAANYAANGQFAAPVADPLNGQAGAYVSQSQSGQLDGYAYKQQSVGDARNFKRIITTCYAGGKCERQELGAAQADGRHQHFVMAARARIAPVSDKCRQIAAGAVGAGAGVADVGGVGSNVAAAAAPAPSGQPVAPTSINRAPSNRPQNRRLFEYSEVVQRDRFN